MTWQNGLQFDSNGNLQVASVGSLLGLTPAAQTQSQVIENQALASGNSLTLATFTGGPGILTKFHFIGATGGNASGYRGLLFSFFVDGEGSPSLQFEADLWGVSQLPATSSIASTSTPMVFESDHLVLLYGKDGSNNPQIEFFFRYQVPFSSSLTITVQNQSFAATSFSAIWSGADVQYGLSSPRRLRNATLVSSNAPAQIPSAVEWQSNYTANGGYAVGNLATSGGALYQCILAISGGLTAPPSDATHWSAVNTSTNQNFNTGYTLLSLNQPCWLAHLTVSGQGPVTGGTYGSVNTNTITFLESNIAVYDGNLSPAASFPGSSPTPTYNSSGTEDFMGGAFYWGNLGDANSSITISATPYTLFNVGKNKQLRHGFAVSANTGGSAFMSANVDLLALCGGIRCGTSCLMRWEQGNAVRATSGPIAIGNTWKINPTILYYV